MLLSFSAKNFRSFREEFTLSMIAAPKQKGLDYSVRVLKNKTRVLCSSVIYGPNASGKTSVIYALDLLKNIILDGNIHNKESLHRGNPCVLNMGLVPNFQQKSKKPVEFRICFEVNENIYLYELSIDLGRFMENVQRKIIRESLSVNDLVIFERSENDITIPNFKKNSSLFPIEIEENVEIAKKLAKNSLSPEELFLTNGFKNVYGKILYPDIFEFFNKKLITFCNFQRVELFPKILNNGIFNDKSMTEAAKAFGSDLSNLVFIKTKDDDQPIMCSRISDGKIIPSEIIESLGTLRFVNMIPAIVLALKNGSTLIIDEFDNSMHPMAVMSLINVFHNDDVNKHGAQLIFNSQNPIYLNNNVFRRDEIKFVDRDIKNNSSTLYSLSDFGTKGTTARKGKDYMENYFVDKYGAIREIDLTDIFEYFLGSDDEKRK